MKNSFEDIFSSSFDNTDETVESEYEEGCFEDEKSDLFLYDPEDDDLPEIPDFDD